MHDGYTTSKITTHTNRPNNKRPRYKKGDEKTGGNLTEEGEQGEGCEESRRRTSTTTTTTTTTAATMRRKNERRTYRLRTIKSNTDGASC